jgi:transcriptional regulator GlxA family with amidase domain
MPHPYNILPSRRMLDHMLSRVAVLALPQVAVFELGVLCELFGYDRSAEGLPKYDFAVCTPDGRPVATHAGFHITPSHDAGIIDTADLVAVAPYQDGTEPPAEVLDALRRAAERGAWVMSVCTGAFALGAAGLLDNRRCTTHWRHTDELARRFPAAKVDPNVLYVADDNILTSAGTAASIDCGLHLVRQVHGSAVAIALARRMVVPPHRDGGQAQYVAQPVTARSSGGLARALDWALSRLDRPLALDDLAREANMSVRTLARRFVQETGSTPHRWITHQRLLAAQRRLETSNESIDAVAAAVGFDTAMTLRHHFRRALGTTPTAYRRRFSLTSG